MGIVLVVVETAILFCVFLAGYIVGKDTAEAERLAKKREEIKKRNENLKEWMK